MQLIVRELFVENKERPIEAATVQNTGARYQLRTIEGILFAREANVRGSIVKTRRGTRKVGFHVVVVRRRPKYVLS